MAYSVAVKQGLLTLMQTVKSTLLALLISCLLAGCGLKGPLYLPTDEPAAKPDTEQNAKTEEEKEEKKEADSPL
jgi:predicted small lipoprotein YifL